MLHLRPYQTTAKLQTYDVWQKGFMNALVVMPTGAGKTVFVSDIFREHKGAAVAIAHRQELVAQISMSLARNGIYHNLIASRNAVKFISSLHSKELNKTFFHPQAPITCAGVDTIIKRDLGQWSRQVTLWAQDEAHHVLKNNKWGKAAELFPNARGLGVTATPERADGKGLGRETHGLFDQMIVGPSMRDLINMGNLTDYKIYAPQSDIDLTNISISQATGDFNQNQLREASKKSHIVGDVVENYIKIAPGKLGVVFAVDIETSIDIATRFKQYGIVAESVSAKTPDHVRNDLIEKFKRREITVLVNVDLFGEGFDLPAIEVCSMARPTESYPLYVQQFGRTLRKLDGKQYGIIIDHVGNVVRHGLPDAPREWSLNPMDRETRKRIIDPENKVTACQACSSVYERFKVKCPYCGFIPVPAERSKPESVDGDLFEMSPEALARLRGEIDEVRETPENLAARMAFAGASPIAINSAKKHKREHLETLDQLIETINYWGAVRETVYSDTRQESYKRFYLTFGVDVLGAQKLPKKEAEQLTLKIRENYEQFL